MRYAIVIAILTVATCYADSKTETDLRTRLAASESARAQAVKDKTALVLVVDRLTKADIHSIGSLKAASDDAAKSQMEAYDTAEIIQQAAVSAAAAAVIAQSQAQRFSASTTILMYVQGLIFVGVVGGFVSLALVIARDHRWVVATTEKTREIVEQTGETIRILEVNTNSIKDALVKVTGEREYARGVKDEADAQEARN